MKTKLLKKLRKEAKSKYSLWREGDLFVIKDILGSIVRTSMDCVALEKELVVYRRNCMIYLIYKYKEEHKIIYKID